MLKEKRGIPSLLEGALTEADRQLLDREGITMEQLSGYVREPLDVQEKETLARTRRVMGYSLVEIAITFNLRKELIDALNQISGEVNLINRAEDDSRKKEIAIRAKETFLRLSRNWLNRNLYPGKGFSQEEGEIIITWAEAQDWAPENIESIWREIFEKLKER